MSGYQVNASACFEISQEQAAEHTVGRHDYRREHRGDGRHATDPVDIRQHSLRLDSSTKTKKPTINYCLRSIEICWHFNDISMKRFDPWTGLASSVLADQRRQHAGIAEPAGHDVRQLVHHQNLHQPAHLAVHSRLWLPTGSFIFFIFF